MIRFMLAALSVSALLLGSPAAAQQHRLSEDEFACKLAHDCGPAAPAGETPAPAEQDGGAMIVGEERGFCFGGSSCARPAAAPAQHLVAAPHAVPRGGMMGQRPVSRTPAYTAPAVRAPVAGHGVAREAADMQLAFANGSAELSADARERIAVLARAMNSRSSLTALNFRIDGHTNAVGQRASNLDLSRRRAQAVVEYMVAQGVARDRLQSQGLGFDEPLPGTRGTDPANRRVEIVRK